MSETPDFFAPLEAWRKFGVTGHGGVLASVGVGGAWTTADPGPAYCQGELRYNPQTDSLVTHDEGCPALGCTCGFYAYKNRNDAEVHGQGHILARIEVWGRIVEHARGYRAERVRLKELFLLDMSGSMVGFPDLLEKRYQIPVTILKGQTAWTSESPYGSSSLSLSVSQAQLQYLNQYNTGLSNYLQQSALQLANLTPKTPLLTTSSGLSSTLGILSAGANMWFAPPTIPKAPKRHYFDFTDMDVNA